MNYDGTENDSWLESCCRWPLFAGFNVLKLKYYLRTAVLFGSGRKVLNCSDTETTDTNPVRGMNVYPLFCVLCCPKCITECLRIRSLKVILNRNRPEGLIREKMEEEKCHLKVTPSFDYCNKIRWRVVITKFRIVQFYPFSSNFIFLRSRCSF